jgi:hypothetical protein
MLGSRVQYGTTEHYHPPVRHPLVITALNGPCTQCSLLLLHPPTSTPATCRSDHAACLDGMLSGCSSAPLVATVLLILTCLTTFNRDLIATTWVHRRPAVQPVSHVDVVDDTYLGAAKPTHAPYVNTTFERSKYYWGVCVPAEKRCKVPAKDAAEVAARPACTPDGPSGWDGSGRWYKAQDGHYRHGALVSRPWPPPIHPLTAGTCCCWVLSTGRHSVLQHGRA